MKKLLIVFRLFATSILSISILLTGCHSFYSIPTDDYNNLEKMGDLKIVYKNGKEFVVEKDDTTNVKIIGDSLVVYHGTEMKFIGMSEVEKIRESRFDLGGTISLIFGIPIAIVIVTGFLLWIFGADFRQ